VRKKGELSPGFRGRKQSGRGKTPNNDRPLSQSRQF